MKIFFALVLLVAVSIGTTGCGSGGAATASKNKVNKSPAVDALVSDTAKIYADFSKQVDSTLSSGKKSNEVVNDLKSICDRYTSRLDIEIGSEFDALEVEEARAYYFAIAGEEVEKPDAVDPEIRKMVEQLKGIAEKPEIKSTPLGDHVKGYVISFLRHSNSKAFGSIAKKVKG